MNGSYQLSHLWDSLLTDIRNRKSVVMKTSDRMSTYRKNTLNWLCYKIFYTYACLMYVFVLANSVSISHEVNGVPANNKQKWRSKTAELVKM